MSETDRLLENARAYADRYDHADLEAQPSRRIAVLACMDTRLIPSRLLGLDEGEAHILRNAGGVGRTRRRRDVLALDLARAS
jgi:carbonic anhydrase